jgi:hypothetical protein
LLEVRLSETRSIVQVVGIRPLEQLCSVSRDTFIRDLGDLPIVLCKREIIPPDRTGFRLSYRKRQSDLRIPPGGQGSDSRHTASAFNSFLESATDSDKIRNKPKSVQEVGFTGGVGTDQEDPTLERDLHP